MRLTTVGKSPSFTDAGGACSAHLVEEGPTAVLLDCGNGAFGRLRALRDHQTLDAVVISHMHADHVLDLVPYAYALLYGPGAGEVRPALRVPPGVRAKLRALCAAWGSEDLLEQAFDVAEYDPEVPLEIGVLRLRFQLVPHLVPAWAVEVAAGGRRLTYGADHGPSDDLVAFAARTDLLVIEATVPEPVEGHLTPAQAGEHARRAAARRVVLTHFTDALDPAWIRAEAERGFGGRVELAATGASFDLS